MTVKCSLKLVQKRIKMTCVWGNQYEKVTVEKPRGTLLDYKEFTPSPLLDVQFSVIQNPGELKLSSGMEYMLSTYEVLCAILRTPQTNKSPVENLRAPIHDTWSEARFCVRKPSSGWSRREWRRRSAPPVKSAPLYGEKGKCSLKQHAPAGCLHPHSAELRGCICTITTRQRRPANSQFCLG